MYKMMCRKTVKFTSLGRHDRCLYTEKQPGEAYCNFLDDPYVQRNVACAREVAFQVALHSDWTS